MYKGGKPTVSLIEEIRRDPRLACTALIVLTSACQADDAARCRGVNVARAGQIDGQSQAQGVRIPFSDLLIGASALELRYAVGHGEHPTLPTDPGPEGCSALSECLGAQRRLRRAMSR